MICACGCTAAGAAQTLPLIGGSAFLTGLFCLTLLIGSLVVIWLVNR